MLMQLYGLRMKKGGSIRDHLRQVDELVDKLTALEENISELNKVAVLLRSVQESYPTLVTALLARGDAELTLIFVKQALLDEEQRRSSGASGETKSGRDSALRVGYRRDRRCWIRSKRNRLVGVGSPVGKLYKLDCKIVPCLKQAAHVTKEDNQKTNLWHKRLAHVNIQQLRQLSTIADGIDIPSNGKYDFCEACVEAKMQRKQIHPLNEIRSTEPLQLIHSDVCGLMQTESIGGSRYFITFIDDHSRYCRCYFMRYKSQALEKFKEFKAEVETESNHVIKALRADRGGEYTSEEFLTYLKENGIRKEFTAAHSPQQNGTAERFNQTLMEAAKSMLIHAKLPNSLWAEVISTASYLRNRMATTALQSKFTLYQLCFGKKPDLRHIRVFGCVVYSHVWEGNPKKLDKKAHKLRFIVTLKQQRITESLMRRKGGAMSDMTSSLMRMTMVGKRN